MQLGKVIGTLVASRKEPTLEGLKLLVVRQCDPSGEPTGAMVIAAVPGQSQTVSWEEASVALNGAIDVHVHASPDSGPRSVDAFEIARIARRHGMRALLFKNHNTQTASLAYLVSEAVPGIEAYGGIALNSAVGGINPIAVAHMARTTRPEGAH